jgi:hypothetical protein
MLDMENKENIMQTNILKGNGPSNASLIKENGKTFVRKSFPQIETDRFIKEMEKINILFSIYYNSKKK